MTAEAVTSRPLSYEGRLAIRAPGDIDLVVIHCTELPDLATAREFGETIRHPDSRTGNSGHFYIDRDGRTERWVSPGRVAHHVRHYNHRSIGIELVNKGRWPDWLHSDRQTMTDPYPEAQVLALLRLLDDLCQQFPRLRWIAGHEELDRERVPAPNDPAAKVFRKRDPGPLFPWPRMLAATPLKRFPT